jgi:hypothetical protein
MIEAVAPGRPATAKVSIVMLFAGLTSGYIVRMAEGNWTQFSIPVEFYFSTGFILVSSFTMHLALRAVKQNQLNMVKRWLIVTLGLGLAFTFCQFLGYNALIQKGVFFADKTTPSGSFFYAITFLPVNPFLKSIIQVTTWVFQYVPSTGTSSMAFGYIYLYFWPSSDKNKPVKD